ncbi:hypothetical protein SDC9_150799 [bioreactor metagenome]|uniref:Uncharacterized protein n=1 Tax=bioreactor metagenome TaxID=1076179 RepID=A0A645ENH4_9ZZZZ
MSVAMGSRQTEMQSGGRVRAQDNKTDFIRSVPLRERFSFFVACGSCAARAGTGECTGIRGADCAEVRVERGLSGDKVESSGLCDGLLYAQSQP